MKSNEEELKQELSPCTLINTSISSFKDLDWVQNCALTLEIEALVSLLFKEQGQHQDEDVS